MFIFQRVAKEKKKNGAKLYKHCNIYFLLDILYIFEDENPRESLHTTNSKCIIDGEKLYVVNIDGLRTPYDICRSLNWKSITILIS